MSVVQQYAASSYHSDKLFHSQCRAGGPFQLGDRQLAPLKEVQCGGAEFRPVDVMIGDGRQRLVVWYKGRNDDEHRATFTVLGCL